MFIFFKYVILLGVQICIFFKRRTLEDLLPAVEMSHLLSVKSGKNPYPTITGFYLSILTSLKCVFLKHNEIEIQIKGFAVRQT